MQRAPAPCGTLSPLKRDIARRKLAKLVGVPGHSAEQAILAAAARRMNARPGLSPASREGALALLGACLRGDAAAMDSFTRLFAPAEDSPAEGAVSEALQVLQAPPVALPEPLAALRAAG